MAKWKELAGEYRLEQCLLITKELIKDKLNICKRHAQGH